MQAGREGNRSDAIDGRAAPSDALPESLKDARRFARAAGLSAGTRARLLVVVDEIVSNITRHGAPPPDSAISWRFARESSQIRLSFTDSGTHFDPRGRFAALPDDDAALAVALDGRGGLGWRLVLAWCDVAVCERRGQSNRLELVLRPG